VQLVRDGENNFLKQLPEQSGVYRYFDENNELLYVGKAINLKKRVSSYFKKNLSTSPRIVIMVSKIRSLELTITSNEHSALILENNLIKSLKPRYNIIFRDDKSYPFLRYSNHEYPKLIYFRGKDHLNNGKMLGPFPNSYNLKKSIEIAQKMFKLRTCSDSEFSNRSRPCMLYQINQCPAPCMGYIDKQDYKISIDLSRDFLQGKYGEVLAKMKQHMFELASQEKFESAALMRDNLRMIADLQKEQTMANLGHSLNIDVILFELNKGNVFIYLMLIRDGNYIGDKQFILKSRDSIADCVMPFLEQYYLDLERPQSIYLHNATLISEEMLDFEQLYTIKYISKKVDKLEKVVEHGKVNLAQVIQKSATENVYYNAVQFLQEYYKLDKINRVECYDISHNQGSDAVGSMVVYQDGKIDNSLYRIFNIDKDIAGDDLRSLEHVLERRLANDSWVKPELIVIDGGINQYKQIKNLLSNHGYCDKIKVCSIVKGDKRSEVLDRIILDSDNIISYASHKDVFYLVQELRDEAHRFAISRHRYKQQKKMTNSVLEQIPGLGKTRIKALLSHFDSVSSIASASVEELVKVNGVGHNLAIIINQFFNNEYNEK